MNKILVIDNFKIFEKWASKTYEYKIQSLKKSKKFTVLNIDEIDSDSIYDNYDNIILGWNMCYYSKYYTLKNGFYKKKIKNLEDYESIVRKTENILKHKNKYLIVQDFINSDDYENGLDSLLSYLETYDFKGIITPYLNTDAMKPLRTNLPNIKFIHLHHHIDETKFTNGGNDKIYDIFIYGNCKGNRYPFRNRVLKILKEMEQDNEYNILFWNDLMSKNYFRFKSQISNNELSNKINQSWLTVCTKSYANILVGKYIETSMSNSCVLGNIPTDGIKIWNNNYVKITENMSDKEIVLVIKDALKNKDLLQENIDIMNKKMESFYLSKYANKLYKKIRN